MEFAEYRAYQPGDDVRHIDRFVYSRSRQHHVRRFHVERQLHGSVIVDASASMGVGMPTKLDHALRLAATFSLTFVTGGDRSQVGVARDGGVRWFRPVARHHQLPHLVRWLEGATAGGGLDLPSVARHVVENASMPGMVVLISDLLGDGVEPALSLFRSEGHETLVVQVLSPEERDPTLLGDGAVWLVDGETGERRTATLGNVATQRYRAAFETWQSEIRTAVNAAQGRHVLSAAGEDVTTLFTRTLRSEGLIR